LDSTLIRVETVAEDWSGVAAWLRRCNKPYKEEALKIVTAGDKKEREEKLQDLWAGEAWDDLMHSAFPALRCVKVSVEYASPEVSLEVPAEETAQIAAPDSNSVRILFPAGIRYVRPEYAGNSVQLQILRNIAGSGKSLRIESCSSPEGDPVCNAALAKKRAECARTWIVENLGIPAEKINVVSCGEDWDGLLREVRENYHGNNRDVVLGILGDTSLSNASKKAAIRSLDGNESWRSLVEGHMSQLRSVRIAVE
jgi:outer membrane protein OmpA-like peptidoglycan-associated protein